MVIEFPAVVDDESTAQRYQLRSWGSEMGPDHHGVSDPIGRHRKTGDDCGDATKSENAGTPRKRGDPIEKMNAT